MPNVTGSPDDDVATARCGQRRFFHMFRFLIGGCPEPVWANLSYRISACPEPVWTKLPLLIYNLETHTNAHAVYYRVVSGRPWHYDGDNPAPYIDPVRDYQIKVLNLLFKPRQAQKTDLNETTRVRIYDTAYNTPACVQ